VVRVKIKTVRFICAGVMWALWKTRNDHIFDNKIVSSPVLMAHIEDGVGVSLRRQWSPLSRHKEKLQFEEAISELWWLGSVERPRMCLDPVKFWMKFTIAVFN